MKIVIHPTIVADKVPEDIDQLPICYTLVCKEGLYCAHSKKSGTLKELYELLEEFFISYQIDMNGLIEIQLDEGKEKYVGHTIDDLIRKYKILNKYQKIVICCPLHYLYSNSYKNGEKKLLKLIYQIKPEERKDYLELEKFYYNHFDSDVQEERKIRFYNDLYSVASQWFDYVKDVIDIERVLKTESDLRKQTTSQSWDIQ